MVAIVAAAATRQPIKIIINASCSGTKRGINETRSNKMNWIVFVGSRDGGGGDDVGRISVTHSYSEFNLYYTNKLMRKKPSNAAYYREKKSSNGIRNKHRTKRTATIHCNQMFRLKQWKMRFSILPLREREREPPSKREGATCRKHICI